MALTLLVRLRTKILESCIRQTSQILERGILLLPCGLLISCPTALPKERVTFLGTSYFLEVALLCNLKFFSLFLFFFFRILNIALFWTKGLFHIMVEIPCKPCYLRVHSSHGGHVGAKSVCQPICVMLLYCLPVECNQYREPYSAVFHILGLKLGRLLCLGSHRESFLR